MKIKVDDKNESWLRKVKDKGEKGEDKPEKAKGKADKGKVDKGMPEKDSDGKFKKKPKKADDASLAIRVAARVLRSRGV